MTRKTEDTLISAAKGILQGNYYSYAALAAAVAAAEEEEWADYQSKNFWPLQARQINLTKNQTNPNQKQKMNNNNSNAEDIIDALIANNVEPRATHTDARGRDWGFVAAYLADDQENYAIQYGNNGTTDYEMTTDIDDLASWLITDDADAAAVANARDEDPEVVADDYTGPCHIISKSEMYLYSSYAYEVDRETNQQDRLEFDSRAEAQEWIDSTETEIYRLAHNESGRPEYFIVAV